MPKHSLLIRSLLQIVMLSSSTAFAISGIEHGNGGGAVVCRDTAGSIASIETLDIYEGRLRQIPFDMQPVTNVQSAVDLLINRLASLDTLANTYREEAADFFDPKISRFLSGITLPFSEDTGPIALPEGCKIEQIILQNQPLVPEDRLYTINNDLWEKLAVQDQAALILHEIIYKDLINQGQTISFWARYFNEMLMSPGFSTTSGVQYIHLLRETGLLLASNNRAREIRDSYYDFWFSAALPPAKADASTTTVVLTRPGRMVSADNELELPVATHIDLDNSSGKLLAATGAPINTEDQLDYHMPTGGCTYHLPEFLQNNGGLGFYSDGSLNRLRSGVGDYAGKAELFNPTSFCVPSPFGPQMIEIFNKIKTSALYDLEISLYSTGVIQFAFLDCFEGESYPVYQGNKATFGGATHFYPTGLIKTSSLCGTLPFSFITTVGTTISVQPGAALSFDDQGRLIVGE